MVCLLLESFQSVQSHVPVQVAANPDNESWESSVFRRQQLGVQGLYHDIDDDDIESGDSYRSRNPRNAVPKEVAKALQDAVSNRPFTASASPRLTKPV